MRALVVESANLEKEADLLIEGDQFHHLKNVVRVKESQEVLLIDGKGRGRIYIINEMKKDSLLLGPTADFKESRSKIEIDFLIGKLKRDAMDLAIKQACELGARRILIADTEYSQSYPLKEERVERLVISAMEQSNNLIKPEVLEIDLKDLNHGDYQNIILFSLKKNRQGFEVEETLKNNTLILIGPEGGFSSSEEEMIQAYPNTKIKSLSTPILRAITAVPCAMGYVLKMYE